MAVLIGFTVGPGARAAMSHTSSHCPSYPQVETLYTFSWSVQYHQIFLYQPCSDNTNTAGFNTSKADSYMYIVLNSNKDFFVKCKTCHSKDDQTLVVSWDGVLFPLVAPCKKIRWDRIGLHWSSGEKYVCCSIQEVKNEGSASKHVQ